VGITVVEHLTHYHMVSGSRPAQLETPDRETLKHILKIDTSVIFKKKFLNIFSVYLSIFYFFEF